MRLRERRAALLVLAQRHRAISELQWVVVKRNVALAAKGKDYVRPKDIPGPKLRAAHHKALEVKYRRAAQYPWLPIEPDPPEPQ